MSKKPQKRSAKFKLRVGLEAIKGNEEAMRMPFTAPRTLFNTELDSRRSIVLCVPAF